MAQEEYKRNRKIYQEKLSGATYRELGLKYYISIDRVFKIVRREKMRDLGLIEKKVTRSKKNVR
jgi:Mor family transcriptional regulator